MNKLALTGATALFLGSSHLGYGSIWGDIGKPFTSIPNIITQIPQSITSGIGDLTNQIRRETEAIERSVKDVANKVADEAKHVADQAASEATHVADAVAKGTKMAGLVAGSIVGLGPKGPSQAEVKAETEKAVLKALLEPSATMVKALYCSDTPMVARSIQALTDDQWRGHKNSILSTYNQLVGGPTSSLEERLKAFFKEAGQGLEVDDKAIAHDAQLCRSIHNQKEWEHSCKNIFPHYDALNLAVMQQILAENRKLLNKTSMGTCQFAGQHASKN